MFFDGAHTSKRTVNLRGSSKHDADKQSFLEKQKQEREKRLQDKQRLKSAITIQSFFRGRTIVGLRKKEERERWDRELLSLSVSNNDALSIASLVRMILFFYKDADDHRRLQVLCNLILDNIVKGIYFY